MMRETLFLSAAAGALGLVAVALAPTQGAVAAEPQVIELTQVPCQFIEPEGANHGYSSTQKADCVAINDENGEERVAKSETLTLKPGKYIFRVKNENVPYDLGFWIRGDGILNRAQLPSTSGGGLSKGMSKDYEIELVAGEYVFSCPLNNTPDYKLVVM